MFYVSLERMTEAADQLHKDMVQLRGCIDELQDVLLSLNTFSYMEESRQRLLGERACVEMQADKAALLEHSLYNIQEQYWRTDRSASAYCETVEQCLPREKVLFQDVSWLFGYVKML